MIEPFCGSAALTLAAAQAGVAQRYTIADAYPPIAALWQAVLADADGLIDGYEALWREEAPGSVEVYLRERRRFHTEPTPARLLYLLARAVKNAPRWGRDGRFNQSADRRRRGATPARLRHEARAIAALLAGRCDVTTADFQSMISDIPSGSLVYLDPPYQGTSSGRDRRYADGLAVATLVEALRPLCRRDDIGLLISYDGRTGGRSHGEALPAELGLRRLELSAGRSSQATLLGRAELTVEALYVGGCLRGADGDGVRAAAVEALQSPPRAL